MKSLGISLLSIVTLMELSNSSKKLLTNTNFLKECVEIMKDNKFIL